MTACTVMTRFKLCYSRREFLEHSRCYLQGSINNFRTFVGFETQYVSILIPWDHRYYTDLQTCGIYGGTYKGQLMIWVPWNPHTEVFCFKTHKCLKIVSPKDWCYTNWVVMSKVGCGENEVDLYNSLQCSPSVETQ